MYVCIYHYPDCSCLFLNYLPFCLTTSLRNIGRVGNSTQINAAYAAPVAVWGSLKTYHSPAWYLIRWNCIHSIYQKTKCAHCFSLLPHCWGKIIFLISLSIKFIVLQCLLFWGLWYIVISFYVSFTTVGKSLE